MVLYLFCTTLTSCLPLLPFTPHTQDRNPDSPHPACQWSIWARLQRGPSGGVQLLVPSCVGSSLRAGLQPGRCSGWHAGLPQSPKPFLRELVWDQAGHRQHPAGPESPPLGQVPKVYLLFVSLILILIVLHIHSHKTTTCFYILAFVWISTGGARGSWYVFYLFWQQSIPVAACRR